MVKSSAFSIRSARLPTGFRSLATVMALLAASNARVFQG
jgi:hypothetical protein